MKYSHLFTVRAMRVNDKNERFGRAHQCGPAARKRPPLSAPDTHKFPALHVQSGIMSQSRRRARVLQCSLFARQKRTSVGHAVATQERRRLSEMRFSGGREGGMVTVQAALSSRPPKDNPRNVHRGNGRRLRRLWRSVSASGVRFSPSRHEGKRVLPIKHDRQQFGGKDSCGSHQVRTSLRELPPHEAFRRLIQVRVKALGWAA